MSRKEVRADADEGRDLGRVPRLKVHHSFGKQSKGKLLGYLRIKDYNLLNEPNLQPKLLRTSCQDLVFIWNYQYTSLLDLCFCILVLAVAGITTLARFWIFPFLGLLEAYKNPYFPMQSHWQHECLYILWINCMNHYYCIIILYSIIGFLHCLEAINKSNH